MALVFGRRAARRAGGETAERGERELGRPTGALARPVHTFLAMTWKALAPAFFALTASTVGCAGWQSPSGQTQRTYLQLTGGGASHQLRLEGRHLYGSRVNVTFYADGFRGTIDGRNIVDLRRSGDTKIVGSVAGGPTDLTIEEGPDGLQVHGLYRGHVGSFFLTPQRLQGLVGPCAYTLGLSQYEPGYVGRRVCGLSSGGARVLLPGAFNEYPAQDRIVMLVLLLGG
jgi:hypothetical protein